jgi:hypothetical protein
MPLKKIVTKAGKAVVSSIQGKKAGQQYAADAAKKAVAAKVSKAKKASAKKSAKATARGLKAAQGPSLAPKGYVPDTTGRNAVKKMMEDVKVTKDGKKYYGEYYMTAADIAKLVSMRRSTREVPNFTGAVKLTENVVSKSGRKANTPKLIKKAAKKKAK